MAGRRDRSAIEQRGDVLVYTTAPLERDLCVIGPVTALLWASSSADDTDFTAALIDVDRGGKAIILTDGICRARFRAAAEGWRPQDRMQGRAPYDALYDPAFRPSPLAPGTPYQFKI